MKNSNLFGRRQHHVVDFLFVIALLFLFAFSTLLLIALGADIYQNIVTQTGDNYELRSSYAYVTQKVRQADDGTGMNIEELDGTPALVLSQKKEDTTYNTYLYAYNGQLMEIFAREDVDVSPSAGNSITPIQKFELTRVNDQLIEILLTESSGASHRIHVASR